jgi:hypothetical protein
LVVSIAVRFQILLALPTNWRYVILASIAGAHALVAAKEFCSQLWDAHDETANVD